MRPHTRRTVLAIGAVLMTVCFGVTDAMARGRGGGGGGGRRGGGSQMRGGGGGGAHMRGGGGQRAPSRSQISRRGTASGGLGSVRRSQTRQVGGAGPRERPTAATRPTPGGSRDRMAATRPGQGGTGALQRPGQGGTGTGQRPATGQAQPADRQAQRSDRQATREASVADRQTRRQDETGDRQQNREDWRDQNREDWQDYGQDRQEDRQDFWDDRLDEGNWSEVDWNEVDWDEVHIYDDDDIEWGTVAAWSMITVGTALTVAAFNDMRSQPACDFYQVEVDGTLYYRCGSTWYIEAYSGGDIRYVAVNPPPGF